MLRQLFRTRGAYNVVNLPVAASQDDPGRADHSADWRHHATYAQVETDLGCKSRTPLSMEPMTATQQKGLLSAGSRHSASEYCLSCMFTISFFLCSRSMAAAQLVCRQIPELGCCSQNLEEKARELWSPE